MQVTQWCDHLTSNNLFCPNVAAGKTWVFGIDTVWNHIWFGSMVLPPSSVLSAIQAALMPLTGIMTPSSDYTLWSSLQFPLAISPRRNPHVLHLFRPMVDWLIWHTLQPIFQRQSKWIDCSNIWLCSTVRHYCCFSSVSNSRRSHINVASTTWNAFRSLASFSCRRNADHLSLSLLSFLTWVSRRFWLFSRPMS
jgi:hypothetical protein